MDVPEKNVVTFQPGKEMEERVRKEAKVYEPKRKKPKGPAAANSANNNARPKPAPAAPKAKPGPKPAKAKPGPDEEPGMPPAGEAPAPAEPELVTVGAPGEGRETGGRE